MSLGQSISHALSHIEHPVTPAMRAPVSHSPVSLSKNLNRLLSAAVVSPSFRRQLLADPAAALAAGYNGEAFHLSPLEYDAVTSLRVSTVRDFAAQLLRIFQYATADAVHFSAEAQTDFRFAEATVR